MLGSLDGVMRIIGRSSEEISSAEITHYLGEADRKLKARYSKDYWFESYNVLFKRNGTPLMDYSLYFPIKDSTFPIVKINGVVQTIGTDYTFSDSVVSFIATLSSGDRISLSYIPDFFDDFANYLASERIYSTSLLDTNNAVSKSIFDTIKSQVKEYEKMAFLPLVATFVDHKEDGNIW